MYIHNVSTLEIVNVLYDCPDKKYSNRVFYTSFELWFGINSYFLFPITNDIFATVWPCTNLAMIRGLLSKLRTSQISSFRSQNGKMILRISNPFFSEEEFSILKLKVVQDKSNTFLLYVLFQLCLQYISYLGRLFLRFCP